MAGSDTVERRLRSLVGSDAPIVTDERGVPTIAPHNTDACALVLRAAEDEGWRVRLAGNETWMAADGPADLILSSRGLRAVPAVRSADLVATVEAGVDSDTLRMALADQGVWWPIDAPGEARTMGSLVATAAAGPLRSGFGSIRDHVLGLTLVTAGGRVVRSGGEVVKNVAGFDLTKMATGSFGAFGFITAIHLRLRAVPRADSTLLTHGDRDTLLDTARTILDAGVSPSALEILSPSAAGTEQWTLAARFVGSDPTVAADRETAKAASAAQWIALGAEDASVFWRDALLRVAQPPMTIRVGALVTAMDQAIDLLSHHLDDTFVSASLGAGAVRWSGAAVSERVKLLRHAAAQVEMPVTVERASWHVLSDLGHFGAYREGVNRLVASLRSAFDPNDTIVVPLGVE